MLQYLLNATAIWLLSLLLFDIFLRRENYHSYNRLFLLCTLLLGVLLPLWHWKDTRIIQTTAMYLPVRATTAARQAIVTAAPVPSVSWQNVVWYIYAVGIIIGVILLLKETFVITRLYKQGIKSKDGVWTIIETGKAHSPFSAFRCIFISNKKNYTPAQLSMILLHEEQHGHALHFVDLLVIQIAKLVFWFHPLVYLYHKRLMMVHEYQADAAVRRPAEEYGHFLVEQSILGAAPALSHSFNRSPVKKRIMMLTHKTTALAKTKRLVAIPLLLACTLFFTQKTFSRNSRKEGNKLYYNGNVFELWAPPHGDTVFVEDPVSGDMMLKITKPDSMPISMNGKRVYTEDELTREEKDAATKTRKAVLSYLYKQMVPAMEQLPDGVYMIFTGEIILDTKGKIVYYSEPIVRDTADYKKQFNDLNNKAAEVLDDAGDFDPVQRGDVPVVFMMRSDMFIHYTRIRVKSHKVTLEERTL